MCDYFCQRMDQNNQGDLTDIFRNNNRTNNDTWHLLPEPAAAFPPSSNNFGDPFVDVRDPLLHELNTTNFFNSSDASACSDDQKMLLEEEGKSSIFSRMLQISPVIAGKMSAEIGHPRLVPGDCGGGLQISSTRVQGIKRRKSQVKKVVCIPAPAAASGRPSGTGEVVPSDLWAWRKYGQKPIKGSPYPRGYYRCSSSKGCSARKQVERSRTDPNMLVITYSSEHNHPWPTQRNALAGSTRSQSSKINNPSTSRSSPHNLNQLKNIKEEHKECSGSAIQIVKEEEGYEMEKAALFDSQEHDFDDFFADLAELDSSDPMNLIFSKLDGEERGRDHKSMDPFNIFDWGGEEGKKGFV
ncbi:probable WRKY transcription factor 14 [Phalaenopsis equestris]|uniref:probable WRKY transcription factor 14 n=1 Tax=Phalaenopsis equestris TaxID=78828 RepID=UPI0009E20875|nr:probable WRKY transcription factor 14 [Phalaenopsis equestris]